jgi:hypothetical protein
MGGQGPSINRCPHQTGIQRLVKTNREGKGQREWGKIGAEGAYKRQAIGKRITQCHMQIISSNVWFQRKSSWFPSLKSQSGPLLTPHLPGILHSSLSLCLLTPKSPFTLLELNPRPPLCSNPYDSCSNFVSLLCGFK